jgi:hypothetical protein
MTATSTRHQLIAHVHVQTVHGFRATARTLIAEVLDVDPLEIEAQIAHAVKDANGRACNRTQFVARLADMMRRWANHLDEMAAAKTVAVGVSL